jgi:hypothetical protein
MAENLVIIRRSSSHGLAVETPEGNFCLSPDDIRNVLFYGRRVLLARSDGIIESDAMVQAVRTGFRGARRIVITVGDRSFSTSDHSFISVVKGKWVAVSMAADRTGAERNVA